MRRVLTLVMSVCVSTLVATSIGAVLPTVASAQSSIQDIERLLQRLQFSEARSIIERQYSSAQKAGIKRDEAGMLVAQSMMESMLNRSEIALNLADKAVGVAKKSGDDQMKAFAYIARSEAYALQNNDEAVDDADDAVSIADKTKGELYVRALIALGNGYLIDKDTTKAIQTFMLAKTITDTSTSTSVGMLLASKANTGFARCMMAYNSEAKVTRESRYFRAWYNDSIAYELATSDGAWYQRFEAGRLHGDILKLMKRSGTSPFLEEATTSMAKTDSAKAVAGLLTYHADNYRNSRANSSAITLYEQAIELLTMVGDVTSTIDPLSHLSTLYYDANRFEDGLRADEKLLSMYERSGNTASASSLRGILVDNYLKYNKPEEAIKVLRKSIDEAKKNDNNKELTAALKNMSVAFVKIGRTDSALVYYEQFLAKSSDQLRGEYVMQLAELKEQVKAAEREKTIEVQKRDLQLKQQELRKAAAEKALKTEQIKVLNNEKKMQADSIAIQQIELARQKEVQLLREREQAQEINLRDSELRAQKIRSYALIGGLGLASLIMLLIYNRYRIKKKSEAEIKAQNVVIQQERERSDQLLLNVLPLSIANRLKSGERHIADHYDNVSILFSDIVGFTKLSERIEPKNMVKILNELFSRYDRLTTDHGVTRIKTVGDAYMIASGAPEQCGDHAIRAARFAIDMQKTVRAFAKEIGEDINIRIGLNSGDAVAAVVGENKFTYDLWSDMVNTAARMESHGVPGKIQVTEEFKREVEKQLGEQSTNGKKEKFTFTSRGQIDVKGKGIMSVYFLEEGN